MYLGIRDSFHTFSTLCVLKTPRAQFFPKIQPSLPPPEVGHSQHPLKMKLPTFLFMAPFFNCIFHEIIMKNSVQVLLHVFKICFYFSLTGCVTCLDHDEHYILTFPNGYGRQVNAVIGIFIFNAL